MGQIANALGGRSQLERGMDREIEDLVSPSISAIFRLTSHLNHSCGCPNALVLSQEFVDAHMDLVSIRDILPGEEILIRYIPCCRNNNNNNNKAAATLQRQRELMAKYLFLCDCNLCTHAQ
eukprot:scaffold1419_cov90-Cylindrotheca_fusiformis.AAC.3